MLLTDMELAHKLGSSFFTEGPDELIKRRVRGLLKKANIEPVVRRDKECLYLESDVHKIAMMQCPLKPQKEKTHSTTKSRVRSQDTDVYERVLKRVTKKKLKD